MNTADSSKIRFTALQTDALLKTSRDDNAINEEATCSTFSDHPQKESATEHFKKVLFRFLLAVRRFSNRQSSDDFEL